MPVIVKLPSGNWRAQVRRKGKYISNTFRRRADADTWAIETERTIDKGIDPKAVNPRSVTTFSEIIDLHCDTRHWQGFPHHHKSAGTAFQRACKELKTDDLHFHDLRHEATSRLFEAGLTIEKVALVTGHRDWKMLRRYTNLSPESLHGKGTVVDFQKASLMPEMLKDMDSEGKSA